MPDYTTMMRDHVADCYQACGLSPDGAAEVANQQAPLSAADQAMLKAIIYSPPVVPNTPVNKATPPPGTQIAPSQIDVVSMG